MIKLVISCWNVSLKKLLIWRQIHPKLIVSDFLTTGRPLRRTKTVHSSVTPQGAWSWSSEAWLANPGGLDISTEMVGQGIREDQMMWQGIP